MIGSTRLGVLTVMLFSIMLSYAQEQIAVIREPFVVLLDATDGSIVDPTFIDLTPLSQGTPKALIQVGEELWITDQIEDRIDRFDLEGNYLSTITGGLDNIKGMAVVDDSEVWVTNAGSSNGAPGDAIIRYDLNGNGLGSINTEPDSSFDIIDVGGEVYVSYIGAGSRIERLDYNGTILGNIVGTGVVSFIQQIEVNTSNNSVYAAVFSTSGGNGPGLYEFSISDGSIINFWAEGSLRGVTQLADGNLLVSGGTNYGVKILDPSNGSTTQLWSDSSQYFGRVNLTPCTTPPTPTGDSNQSFVEGATIEDIVVDPSTVSWYPTENDALNSTNELPAGTLLVDGETYWAVNIVNGCKSLPFGVTVDVCTIPDMPTGATTQSLPEGSTIEDIVVDPSDVTWFATESDAINNTNPLPAGTVLVDGETYWAASIDGLCISDPLDVTITILLGLTEFQHHGIYVYPNPATEVLNLNSTQLELERVAIFNVLGSKLTELEVTLQEFAIDLSSLSSGMYILKVQSANKSFTTRFIKR